MLFFIESQDGRVGMRTTDDGGETRRPSRKRRASLLAREDEVAALSRANRELTALRARLEMDVSARTASLTAALEEARAANALRERYLATMSHEVRTPAAGLIGMIELAAREGDPSLRESYLADATLAARHLIDVATAVLDHSKLEAGALRLSPGPVRAAEMIDAVRAVVAPLAEGKGLALRISVEGLEAPFLGDETRLRQILVNLCGNAVKFTDAGELRLRASGPAGRAVFDVEDTGRGVPEADRERLFDEYAQSRPDDPGAGLGLPISARLADLMGGAITVGEGPEGGALFRLDIPRLTLPGAPETAPEGDAGAPAQARAPARILLVDDQRIMRRVTSAFLASEGWEVCEAASGADALDQLAGGRFDLILSDLRMPEMDGRVLAEKLRAGDGPNAGAPFILLTADTGPTAEIAARAAGAAALLVKPVARDALVAAVAAALD